MSFQKGAFEIDDGQFQSNLDIPDGNNPDQNAWLTITVRYRLNFVDDYNEPWLERIADHTGIERSKSKWTATLDTNTPPRKIPLGVALVGMPAQF
jgi:hypothetical protein